MLMLSILLIFFWYLFLNNKNYLSIENNKNNKFKQEKILNKEKLFFSNLNNKKRFIRLYNNYNIFFSYKRYFYI